MLDRATVILLQGVPTSQQQLQIPRLRKEQPNTSAVLVTDLVVVILGDESFSLAVQVQDRFQQHSLERSGLLCSETFG